MLIIQDKFLISDEIVREQFICNLEACKGACCWEGDAGAPLEPAEIETLKALKEQILPFISAAGAAELDRQGTSVMFTDPADQSTFIGTPLINGGPCAYMVLDGNGMAHCGIERAWKAGAIDYQKPISCHLYPIRVETSEKTDFIMLNYDRWDICSAACSKGIENNVRVYQFLKEPLIRAYGEDFYEELDGAATYLLEH